MNTICYILKNVCITEKKKLSKVFTKVIYSLWGTERHRFEVAAGCVWCSLPNFLSSIMKFLFLADLTFSPSSDRLKKLPVPNLWEELVRFPSMKTTCRPASLSTEAEPMLPKHAGQAAGEENKANHREHWGGKRPALPAFSHWAPLSSIHCGLATQPSSGFRKHISCPICLSWFEVVFLLFWPTFSLVNY